MGGVRDNPLDAAALVASLIPGVGDVIGVANDVRHFVQEPESRTFGNFALAGAGLLPFVPPMAGIRMMVRGGKKLALKKSGFEGIYEGPGHIIEKRDLGFGDEWSVYTGNIEEHIVGKTEWIETFPTLKAARKFLAERGS